MQVVIIRMRLHMQSMQCLPVMDEDILRTPTIRQLLGKLDTPSAVIKCQYLTPCTSPAHIHHILIKKAVKCLYKT